MTPLVIGCGHPDRGDDAAGLLAARFLCERGVDAVEHRRDALALLDLWAAKPHVILVDAILTGRRRGAVSIWDVSSFLSVPDLPGASTHNFSLAEAMRLGHVLGRLPGRLQIYGIESREFALATPPSPRVVAGARRAARMIVEEIAPCTNRHSSPV